MELENANGFYERGIFRGDLKGSLVCQGNCLILSRLEVFSETRPGFIGEALKCLCQNSDSKLQRVFISWPAIARLASDNRCSDTIKLISVIKKVTPGPGHAGMSGSEGLKPTSGSAPLARSLAIIPRGYLAAFQ